jgi:hypothetical protein
MLSCVGSIAVKPHKLLNIMKVGVHLQAAISVKALSPPSSPPHPKELRHLSIK